MPLYSVNASQNVNNLVKILMKLRRSSCYGTYFIDLSVICLKPVFVSENFPSFHGCLEAKRGNFQHHGLQIKNKSFGLGQSFALTNSNGVAKDSFKNCDRS